MEHLLRHQQREQRELLRLQQVHQQRQEEGLEPVRRQQGAQVLQPKRQGRPNCTQPTHASHYRSGSRTGGDPRY